MTKIYIKKFPELDAISCHSEHDEKCYFLTESGGCENYHSNENIKNGCCNEYIVFIEVKKNY